MQHLPFDIIQTLLKTFADIGLHDNIWFISSRLLDTRTVGGNVYFAKLSQKR